MEDEPIKRRRATPGGVALRQQARAVVQKYAGEIHGWRSEAIVLKAVAEKHEETPAEYSDRIRTLLARVEAAIAGLESDLLPLPENVRSLSIVSDTRAALASISHLLLRK